MKRKFTCESFLEFQFISDPRISPDGRHTAFIVKQADIKANCYRSDLYLYEHETELIKKMSSIGDVTTYLWRDDHTILFPGVRSERAKKEGMGYYLLDIRGGEAKEVFTLPVKGGQILYAGNGNYAVIAPYWNEEVKSRYERIREVPFLANGVGYTSGKRNRLYLYREETKEFTPITAPTFHVAGMKAEDGKILYIGQEFQEVKSLKNGVYLYDIETERTECLLEPEQYLVKGFELYRDAAVLNLTDGLSYGNGENGDFYLIDLQSKIRKKLCDYREHCVGSTVTSDVKLGSGQTMKIDGEYLYYTSTVEMNCILQRMELQTGKLEKVTTDGAVDFIDVQDKKVVCVAFVGNRLPELYEVKQGEYIQLTHFNDWIEQEYEISTPEYIESKGSAPWEIQGYVLKPVGYEEGKKYPAILSIHGGPRLTYGLVFMHQMQMFASEGYFVFFCNPRGAEGRGNDFADIRKQFGEIDFTDFMEFTDTVLEKYSDIDRSKVAVEGGSYGGFMTNWIIGHTNRFAAACAQRSISNWTGMEGTTDIGYYFCKGQTGASHMEDHALQWKQSPLAYADRCTTPTLFIHGEKDYRCAMQEAFQMFSALKMHGCPAKLCLFAGENHELSRSGRPKQRLQRLEEIRDWFAFYIKNKE